MNDRETAPAESLKKANTEAPSAKENGPRARLTSEVLPEKRSEGESQEHGKYGERDLSTLIEPGEQLKVRGSDATVSKSAWENPGSFVVSNQNEHTTRIEGYIGYNDAKRTSAEEKVQHEAAARGIPEEGQTLVGSHRIAHSLGGPRVTTHGRDMALANMECGDGRINGSMINKVIEMAILSELKESPYKKLFMQVDTRRDPDGKQWVTHRIFEVDHDGMPKGRPVKEIQTREDRRPNMTAGKAVASIGGGSVMGLNTPTTNGAHRSRHGDH